jgi:hypothetical protein
MSSIHGCAAPFQSPGVAFDKIAGTTYDGRVFDFDSGELSGPAWTFSAASKESLHMPLLALAVAGNPFASILYSPTVAVAILTSKIAALEQFNATYPVCTRCPAGCSVRA